MPRRSKKDDATTENTRIAIVNADKCKPRKCNQECKKGCPVVRLGKLCIEVSKTSKTAAISEDLCIGCGICVKKCPFEAVRIINLPKALQSQTTHRYGPNSFKLHRLPMPRPNEVLGLVGTNGIGKSTALKILSGHLKPNLGAFDAPPDWEEILKHFRGSELQNYFTKILEDNLKAITKPQYVDHIPKAVKGEVGKLIKARDKRNIAPYLCKVLDLHNVMDREVSALSGGELQRFAIAVVAVQRADVYMFDEPSSYLDVRQRLRAAQVIRSLVDPEIADYMATKLAAEADKAEQEAKDAKAAKRAAAKAAGDDVSSSESDSEDEDETKVADAGGAGGGAGAQDGGKKKHRKPSYVVVVEHDLAVLDYLSDYICCLYGVPGAYGVVTMPFSVRDGINVFLAGFVPTENTRFRDEELTFKVVENVEEIMAVGSGATTYHYPKLKKTLRSKSKSSKFKLTVKAGSFNNSQIIVMLGENGTGKTTFIRMLAGGLKPDPPKKGAEAPTIDGFSISYKPQKISPSGTDTVRVLLHRLIRDAYAHPQFQTDVVKPLLIEEIIDQEVKHLSGGELQRLAICVALGTKADVYLIDEPSAYLDSEQRIVAAKVIKRFILHAKKTAFIVEHDFIMATYLADRVIVYSGTPGLDATANAPQSLLSGMNEFLRQLEITFRRDPTNFRPRINKLHSVKDQEQKRAGTFFYMDD